MAGAIPAFGWHPRRLIDGRTLTALAPRLARPAVPIVVDHTFLAAVFIAATLIWWLN